MPPRILVVDDEPMARALIVRVLTEEGCQVVGVANGQAALVAGRTAQEGFDLIVTNSWTAGLSGSEIISRLQQDFPSTPILHIDDLPCADRASDAFVSPRDSVTFRPFSLRALKQAARQLLGD
jgi:CheY-like chemotaxis protein